MLGFTGPLILNNCKANQTKKRHIPAHIGHQHMLPEVKGLQAASRFTADGAEQPGKPLLGFGYDYGSRLVHMVCRYSLRFMYLGVPSDVISREHHFGQTMQHVGQRRLRQQIQNPFFLDTARVSHGLFVPNWSSFSPL